MNGSKRLQNHVHASKEERLALCPKVIFKFICILSGMDPNLIIIISGKRKSGKDYISNKLSEMLKGKFENLTISYITLAAILKETFAIENNLDYEKLLDSSEYKEKYRKDLIKLAVLYFTFEINNS